MPLDNPQRPAAENWLIPIVLPCVDERAALRLPKPQRGKRPPPEHMTEAERSKRERESTRREYPPKE